MKPQLAKQRCYAMFKMSSLPHKILGCATIVPAPFDLSFSFCMCVPLIHYCITALPFLLHTVSLPFPSLPFPSLPFPSLSCPSLHPFLHLILHPSLPLAQLSSLQPQHSSRGVYKMSSCNECRPPTRPGRLQELSRQECSHGSKITYTAV